MTLTYKLDLDTLPLDLHAKNKDCLSVRSSAIMVTDRQTLRHPADVKTITPITSETWGVMNSPLVFLFVHQHEGSTLCDKHAHILKSGAHEFGGLGPTAWPFIAWCYTEVRATP